MVATEVINEGKKAMKWSLVGFLKENEGISKVLSWFNFILGKPLLDVEMTGPLMVWTKLRSEAEVVDSLYYAENYANSPFLEIGRWMEILESLACDILVKFEGVLLHVWREEIFSLLGDCMRSTLEVDPAIAKKQVLLFGRVKVARDINQRLPQRVFLYLDDLYLLTEVEVETEAFKKVKDL